MLHVDRLLIVSISVCNLVFLGHNSTEKYGRGFADGAGKSQKVPGQSQVRAFVVCLFVTFTSLFQILCWLSCNKNVIFRYRVDWQRHQKRIKEREEAEAEKERQAYAQVGQFWIFFEKMLFFVHTAKSGIAAAPLPEKSCCSRWFLTASLFSWIRFEIFFDSLNERILQIDWHDFVVVQTVDFQPNETGKRPHFLLVFLMRDCFHNQNVFTRSYVWKIFLRWILTKWQ